MMYLLSLLMVLAGIFHFVKPKFFLAIMPPYIPAHQLMVALSGFVEIIFGAGLLFENTRSWAAWGLVALFVAVFPANIYMATSDKFKQFPKWILYARLPLQFALMAWAYSYA